MKEIDKVIIDGKYFPSLGRIFTPVVMDGLALEGFSAYLTEVCLNSGLLEQIDPSITLKKFLNWIYNILFKHYRNEYIYKNVIANKILLGRHSLDTTHMLMEFRVGRCKADVVVINGTSTVYEIKSEFDSFARLENQIHAYLELFDHIYVITTASQADKLESILPDTAGILILTNRYTISTIRDSKSNKKTTNLKILFDSLRKTEYLRVIKEYYGAVPDIPNTHIHSKCKKLFCEIPPNIAHKLTLETLRKRNNNTKLMKEFIDKAPQSLSAYALSICNEKVKMQGLISRFSTTIGSVLNPKLV